MEEGRSRFVISAPDAAAMATKSNISPLSLLPTLVPRSQPLARPPVSNFSVAAVGLSSDGRIFVGVNLEFPGLPLHHSVHAEQFLVTNLAVHDGGCLVAFAVSAAPCGHCRQFLQELRSAPDLQICITSDDVAEFKPLITILPSPFGPFDLLDSKSPLLLESNHNRLSLLESRSTTSDASELCNGHCESEYPDLEIGALEAANRSHAPYSHCPSGVALMDHEGKIYKGSYTESAAFNPSLGPVQAAVIAYVAGGGGGYENIVAGVLVEREEAVVRQEETARLLLKLIAPKCELRVLHCKSN